MPHHKGPMERPWDPMGRPSGSSRDPGESWGSHLGSQGEPIGRPWQAMEAHGGPWRPMGPHGRPWPVEVSQGTPLCQLTPDQPQSGRYWYDLSLRYTLTSDST